MKMMQGWVGDLEKSVCSIVKVGLHRLMQLVNMYPLAQGQSSQYMYDTAC